MTLITLFFILALIGILFIYLISENHKRKQSIVFNEENISLCEKHIIANTKAINKLSQTIKELDTKVSTVKFDMSFLNSDLKDKILSLKERWKIISDERITSIPSTEKEWFEARQIVAQPMLKTWKPKNLTQSKGSVFNTSDEAINQDFSEMDDAVFEKIMDEDKKGSSTGFATQELKPKPKSKPKSKPRTMTP